MKPSKLLLPFLWSMLAFQLSSCTSMIIVENVRPPVVQVQHDQWKVLVVNRYDAASQAAGKNENVRAVLQDGAYQAVGGAMGAVFNDSTFVLVNTDQAINLPASSDQLSQQEVADLFKQYGPHLILTLDKFDARLGKEVSSYEDEDGFRSKTADYDLIVSSTFALYDSTGTMLDRATVREQEYYDSRAVVSGLLAIGPAMGKAGTVINRLAVETGYSYWDRFYPQPQMLVRQVHLTNALQPANLYLMMGQHQQAIETLLPMAQDPNNKRSAKAAHNLAVAYEVAGDFEQATHWAREAHGRGDKLALNLLELWGSSGLLK